MTLEETSDGQYFIQILLKMYFTNIGYLYLYYGGSDENYFKQTAMNLASGPSPIAQHSWVLNAARLKRIYLRLLGHYSFALCLDPSRLPVPDCNSLARRSVGWEGQWLRLAGLLFYALYQANGQVHARFNADPIVGPWIQQVR